jgi:hypothetical protein
MALSPVRSMVTFLRSRAFLSARSTATRSRSPDTMLFRSSHAFTSNHGLTLASQATLFIGSALATCALPQLPLLFSLFVSFHPPPISPAQLAAYFCAVHSAFTRDHISHTLSWPALCRPCRWVPDAALQNIALSSQHVYKLIIIHCGATVRDDLQCALLIVDAQRCVAGVHSGG